jgi:hypothetical protein
MSSNKLGLLSESSGNVLYTYKILNELAADQVLMTLLTLLIILKIYSFGIILRFDTSFNSFRHTDAFDGIVLINFGSIVTIYKVFMIPQIRFIDSFIKAARKKFITIDAVNPWLIIINIAFVVFAATIEITY